MVMVYNCFRLVIVFSKRTTIPPPSTVSIVRASKLGVKASKSFSNSYQVEKWWEREVKLTWLDGRTGIWGIKGKSNLTLGLVDLLVKHTFPKWIPIFFETPCSRCTEC